MQPKDVSESTRFRILREAAALFAAKGYHGTSTRDIAVAAELRQPTLYWHFPTKQSIMIELIDTDITAAALACSEIVKADASAGARLFRFVHFDMTQLALSPYNLVAIYDTQVLDAPEFAEVNRKGKQITRGVRSLLRDGIESGQLAHTDLAMGRELIYAVELHAGRAARSLRAAERKRLPGAFSEFALRGLLADPATLEDVRDEAMRIILPESVTQGAFDEYFRKGAPKPVG
ncbi:TetR/AcrR family transcriptional regulator [Rhodococcus sp. IC4_135]|uniref:TetR family transcriptional regulator n=1 Tax=Rhodococcus sp. IC4_135 TaxID=2715537 RepID=UPI00141F6B17|nr:TetR/AcrR family transcriptional regulator [Rhodococcus sp. IC4_135]